MDDTCEPGQKGLLKLRRLLLMLFLAGLQLAVSADGDDPELDDEMRGQKMACTIVGPDFVTVGVPSSVECDASCHVCTYSMSVDGQAAQGQGSVLAFTVHSWTQALTVTCTVTDDLTQLSATATKQLKVLAGPANVSITGPDLMNPTVSHTYSCHAYCRPSCTYAWRTGTGPWIGGQGNVISVTPQEVDGSRVLICKATNSVSGMFVTAARNVSVMSGPSDLHIRGPDEIEMAEKSKFVCAAECVPSCRFVSSVDGHTVRGNVVEVTVDHPLKSVTVRCEAQNTASRKTASASKTVRVKGADHNPSARPEESLVLLLVSVVSAALTL